MDSSKKIYPYKYAHEKLERAVYILTTGKGDVRSRLRGTYRHLRMLGSHNMPVHLHKDLQWIKSSMVKFEPLVDSYGSMLTALEHTMQHIRNGTGAKLAMEIFSMKSRLAQRCS